MSRLLYALATDGARRLSRLAHKTAAASACCAALPSKLAPPVSFSVAAYGTR